MKKQKDSMEVLFLLKQHMKERRCSLLESFETYKSPERFKSTKIHLDEYIKVLNSIEFFMDEAKIYKCLECFEVSSKGTLSYLTF